LFKPWKQRGIKSPRMLEHGYSSYMLGIHALAFEDYHGGILPFACSDSN
jgi:hypothetical protein